MHSSHVNYTGFEIAFAPELFALGPVQQMQLAQHHEPLASPQLSGEASRGTTPRAQSPTSQATASATQPPSSESDAVSKQENRRDKGRRSLGFRRHIGSVDEAGSNGTSSGKLSQEKLNGLGLSSSTTSTLADQSTTASASANASVSASGQDAPSIDNRTKEQSLRNRLSLLRTTGRADDASSPPDVVPVSDVAISRSQTQTTDGALEQRSSRVSSDRSAVDEGRESASGRSGKSGERSRSREGRGGLPAEGTKKRFSILGLRRKGSKSDVGGGSGVGSRVRRDVVPEE